MTKLKMLAILLVSIVLAPGAASALTKDQVIKSARSTAATWFGIGTFPLAPGATRLAQGAGPPDMFGDHLRFAVVR